MDATATNPSISQGADSSKDKSFAQRELENGSNGLSDMWKQIVVTVTTTVGPLLVGIGYLNKEDTLDKLVGQMELFTFGLGVGGLYLMSRLI